MNWEVINQAFEKWFGEAGKEVCSVVVDNIVYVFTYEEMRVK